MRVHTAGTAVYRDGELLENMFIEGRLEPAGGLLQPGASVAVEVRGPAGDAQGTICGVDLFIYTQEGLKKDAVSLYSILPADILTFVPSIRVSWPEVNDCDIPSDQCTLHPFTDSGALTVRYRE